MRVDYALRELQSWYLGDGTYGDGPHFHWDFYNSFVIQPYLLQLMDTLGDQSPSWSIDARANPRAHPTLRRNPGATHRPGRLLPRNRPLHHLSLRRLPSPRRRVPPKVAPRKPDRTAGPLRPVRCHKAHPRTHRHILQRRLATDWPRRPSTWPRRNLHLNRKPLPLQRSLAPPRPSPNRPILVATPCTLDITNHLVRQKHSGRPCPR